MSPDGESIALGGYGGLPSVRRRGGKVVGSGDRGGTLQDLAPLRRHSVAFSPDGEFLVTAGWGGTAKIIDRTGT